MAAYTEIFDGLDHLGPGDPDDTRDVLEIIRSSLRSAPRVADFGCGVGASTLVLAKALPAAHLLALDSHAPFISRLQSRVTGQGMGDRINAVVGDMAEPPAMDGIHGEFDLIWSESAIYAMGRNSAFRLWRPLLRTNGWLVFSDIIWQREPDRRSTEADAFWGNEYPEITTADAIVAELATAGLRALDPVSASRKAWSNYYEPLRNRLSLLGKRHDRSQALIGVMAELEKEMAIYDQYGDEVDLVFFLATL
ncbi:MAG: class I SAM-dependent methyltransferase [Gammaproteobacteria bacterium]